MCWTPNIRCVFDASSRFTTCAIVTFFVQWLHTFFDLNNHPSEHHLSLFQINWLIRSGNDSLVDNPTKNRPCCVKSNVWDSRPWSDFVRCTAGHNRLCILGRPRDVCGCYSLNSSRKQHDGVRGNATFASILPHGGSWVKTLLMPFRTVSRARTSGVSL